MPVHDENHRNKPRSNRRLRETTLTAGWEFIRPVE